MCMLVYFFLNIFILLLKQYYELDLSTVSSCCSGPKRPHDKVLVTNMKEDFKNCLTSPVGFKVNFLYEIYISDIGLFLF